MPENSKNSNQAIFPDSSTLEDIEDPYWYKDDTEDETKRENTLQTLPRISHISVAPFEIFDHEPLNAKVLKATSGISVKQALQINEKKKLYWLSWMR